MYIWILSPWRFSSCWMFVSSQKGYIFIMSVTVVVARDVSGWE